MGKASVSTKNHAWGRGEGGGGSIEIKTHGRGSIMILKSKFIVVGLQEIKQIIACVFFLE